MKPATTSGSMTSDEAPENEEEVGGERVYQLFRLPQGRSRMTPGERAVFETARRDRLPVNGKLAVTYRWGDGARPVLLVHGWESRGSRYAKVIDRLNTLGYSPVTFDAPGHGDATGGSTTLLEYREIISALHRIHGDFEAIVAHSLGVTATFMALREGVHTRGVVAIGSVPDFTYVVDTFCDRWGLGAGLREELRARIEEDMYPGERDMWRRFSVLHDVASVRGPLLFIHDEDDNRVPPRQVERMVEVFGNRARLVTTRRFGHQRILGAPRVVEEVAAFVGTVPTGAGTTEGAS